jgi:2-oxoglutarate dehydrogenase E1 component
MQLSAEFNWEVCVPSNAAQVYHMLRRQMLRKQRKPLIVMTPKSLLRHKDATSSLEELANGTFQTIIGEVDKLDPKKVTRVVACAGKIYFDLLAARREKKIDQRVRWSVSSSCIPSTTAACSRRWRSIPSSRN